MRKALQCAEVVINFGAEFIPANFSQASCQLNEPPIRCRSLSLLDSTQTWKRAWEPFVHKPERLTLRCWFEHEHFLVAKSSVSEEGADGAHN